MSCSKKLTWFGPISVGGLQIRALNVVEAGHGGQWPKHRIRSQFSAPAITPVAGVESPAEGKGRGNSSRKNHTALRGSQPNHPQFSFSLHWGAMSIRGQATRGWWRNPDSQ